MLRRKKAHLLVSVFILFNALHAVDNIITAKMNSTLYFAIQRTSPKVIVNKHNADNSTLQKLVDTFIAHLETQQHASITTKPKLAIFDIYDTLLTQQGTDSIKPVVMLYNYFLTHNYTLVLISGRKNTPERKKQTIQRLNAHKIVYKQNMLFLRPTTWSQSVGNWKESIRKQLNESYDIIATIDDDWHNLTGSYVGVVALWVPSSQTHPGSKNFHTQLLKHSGNQFFS
jgi:hypothetical protein